MKGSDVWMKSLKGKGEEGNVRVGHAGAVGRGTVEETRAIPSVMFRLVRHHEECKRRTG